MSRRSFDSTTAPPPSYHSVDGLWQQEARRARSTRSRDDLSSTQRQNMTPRLSALGDEELMISHRPGEGRRRHHHSRRPPCSLGKTGTAKLALEVLKSNLMAGSRHGRERPFASWRQKLDCSRRRQEVHYVVHNHWHATPPAESTPNSGACTYTEPVGLSSHSDVPPMNDVVEGGRLDPSSAAQRLAALNLRQGHATLLEADRHPREQHDPDGIFGDFLRPPPCHAEHERSGPSRRYAGWPGAEAEDVSANAWRCSWDAGRFPTGTNSYGNTGKSREPCKCGAHDCRYPSVSPPWAGMHDRACDGTMPRPAGSAPADAKTGLEKYKQRWEYLDSVQRPYLHELPWPMMRAGVSFDHMKCDVFSFFARGCGLQPDRSKAPKLDFQLSARSPYPSFDQRQQECERMMLKAFKQQMQREKLHWHEDKLKKKFSELIGRADDERRKAVWAAIAEGSAICDKRLSNML